MLPRHLLFHIISLNFYAFYTNCENNNAEKTQLRRIKRQNIGGLCSPLVVFNGQVNYMPTTSSTNLGQIASGTTAGFVCNAGFIQSGNPSATCNNGGWSQPLGICQASGGIGIGSTLMPGGISSASGQCAAMIPPAFGQLSYNGAGQTNTGGIQQQQQFGPFPTGTTVQLICPSGTFSSGTSQASCSNGQWIPNQLGQCQSTGLGGVGVIGSGGSCAPQITPANGQIIYSTILQPGQTMYSSGTTATLSTPPLNGQSVSTCLNSFWNPPLGICSITGGTQGIFPTSFPGGTSFGSTCLFGMLPPLGGTIQYSGGSTQQLGGVGSSTGPPYSEGTTATLVCQQGVPSQPSAVCTRGQWQPPNLTGCSGSLFGVTPSIISGFGTQTAGQCLLGLVALGGTVFYSNSGTNSGVSNTGTLVGSVNTNIGSSQTGPYPQGTTAQAQCPNGQIPTNGATSATCISSQWQPSSLGSCLSSNIGIASIGVTIPTSIGQGTCLFGPIAINGRVTFSNGQTIGPFPAGTTATMSCNAGFIPNGLATSICTNSAFPPLGTCMPSSSDPSDTSSVGYNNSNLYNSGRVQCFDMPQPINGATFIYSPPNANSPFPIGTTATLVCANGTQLSDGSTVGQSVMCMYTGWSKLTFDPCLPSSGLGVTPSTTSRR
uniref:Sushi domain-containing protein n=1 Tax=Meloidogyne floridensis TaxID=298350 RepID=A0A915NVL2_9BILA